MFILYIFSTILYSRVFTYVIWLFYRHKKWLYHIISKIKWELHSMSFRYLENQKAKYKRKTIGVTQHSSRVKENWKDQREVFSIGDGKKQAILMCIWFK